MNAVNANLNWSLRPQFVQAGTVDLRNSLDILSRATVDEDLAQRIFVDWDDKRKQSYISSLLTGTNLTSVFVLADLKAILLSINSDIESVNEQIKTEEVDEQDAKNELVALSQNKEYFQSLINDGYDYLLLDGKHRAELLIEVFNRREFKFDDDSFDGIIQTNGVSVNLNGRTLKNFDVSLTEFIKDNTQTLITIIQNGRIEDMQGIFVKTNSGLQLVPMELRICTMSIVARFVRGLTKSDENPTICAFFNALKGLSTNPTNVKSLEKKGDLLLISTILAYYFNKIKENKTPSKTFFSDEYLNKMYQYDFQMSKSDESFIREVFHILAKGSLEEYKKAKSAKNPKYVGLTWADTQNITLMMMLLLSGKTNYLKSVGSSVDVVKDKEAPFFRRLFEAMVHLMDEDLFEVDTNGSKILKNDKYGNPLKDKKGNLVYIENEHSFKRKNRNNNEENQHAKLMMFEEYLQKNNIIQSMVDDGIIILVDTKRTLSKDEKRYQAIVNQKSIDVFSGKKLSLGEIESGLTANSHIEAHSKGGSKMVVGNSKANLKSKTDTIYNAL
jgi:hypothetical protein